MGRKKIKNFLFQRRGFSLIELLIAMAVGLIVVGAAYQFFISQNKTYKLQEQIAEVQQNVRAAMETMVRELRMTGFDNFNATKIAGIVSANASSIRFTQNITSTNPSYVPDTDVQDPNEDIAYYVGSESCSNCLIRKARERTSSTSASELKEAPLAENVQSLAFRYFDAGNTELSAPVAVPANIRRIEITLKGKTSKPDPGYSQNGGYRTYELKSQVVPRNLP